MKLVVVANITFSKISFYQLYGRAMAKVFLMSLFVYQGLYFIWIKAETAEIKKVRSGRFFLLIHLVDCCYL